MRTSHREYTLPELSAMTGLSTHELVAQLTANCKASMKAGIRRSEVRTGTKEVVRRFVEVLPNGEINPDSVITSVKLQTTFRVPKNW
jgi:uncharacterized protein YidB (DUF937 family)